jgi:hypothetical protein
MSKKLYLVDVSTVMMVMANDRDEAEAVAEAFQHDNEGPWEFDAMLVTHPGVVPADWLDGIPWHDAESNEPERTVQQILNERK